MLNPFGQISKLFAKSQPLPRRSSTPETSKHCGSQKIKKHRYFARLGLKVLSTEGFLRVLLALTCDFEVVENNLNVLHFVLHFVAHLCLQSFAIHHFSRMFRNAPAGGTIQREQAIKMCPNEVLERR